MVALYGVLRGDSDLLPLTLLRGEIYFRLREFRRISSDSVQRWIEFMRGLDMVRRSLLECPISFIHQANLITNLLERQEVESFFAPYACDNCGLEEEKLIDVAATSTAASGARRPTSLLGLRRAARLRRPRRAVLRLPRSLSAPKTKRPAGGAAGRCLASKRNDYRSYGRTVERPLPLARAVARQHRVHLAESASIRSPDDMQPAALTTSFIFEPTIRISFEALLPAFLAALCPSPS